MTEPGRAGERAALWLLALAAGLLPAAPALLRGELIGHPFTDLYPAVWGLWASAQAEELLPARTALLGFPEGMGFAYSSPIKALLARPLLPILGLPATWNLLLVTSRVATIGLSGEAARAWGARPGGSLLAAVIFGASPFFHGYAVEGIVEGTDGWTLALWAWAVGRGRGWLALPLMALTILSSWYLGAAGLLLAGLLAPLHAAARPSLLAPLLAWPALSAFLTAFPGLGPLDPQIRAAMGAPLLPRPPGALPGLQPFARTTWVGLLLPALLLRGRARIALLAMVPALLSLGQGPWYELPGLSLLRFPYRLHAATLAILALAAARLPLRRPGTWALLLLAEGALFSPIEPILPGAPAEVPALYRRVQGPLLVVPTIEAMPPGVENPTRARARQLLYYQSAHGQPSPWTPDFNGVGVHPGDAWLDPLRAFDPRSGRPAAPLPAGFVEELARRGVQELILEGGELGASRSRALLEALQAQGARIVDGEGSALRLALPVEAGPTR